MSVLSCLPSPANILLYYHVPAGYTRKGVNGFVVLPITGACHWLFHGIFAGSRLDTQTIKYEYGTPIRFANHVGRHGTWAAESFDFLLLVRIENAPHLYRGGLQRQVVVPYLQSKAILKVLPSPLASVDVRTTRARTRVRQLGSRTASRVPSVPEFECSLAWSKFIKYITS